MSVPRVRYAPDTCERAASFRECEHCVLLALRSHSRCPLFLSRQSSLGGIPYPNTAPQ